MPLFPSNLRTRCVFTNPVRLKSKTEIERWSSTKTIAPQGSNISLSAAANLEFDVQLSLHALHSLQSLIVVQVSTLLRSHVTDLLSSVQVPVRRLESEAALWSKKHQYLPDQSAEKTTENTMSKDA